MAPAASDKAEQAGKKSAVKEEAASDVEDDDEEDDDVSCATRVPLIFARIPHHEPIPALPDVSNPPRIGRARVGAANSALRTAFTGVESSICYFCRVTNQGKLHGSYPPEPPRSPRASPSVPRLIQPKVSKTKKTCSSIYRGVRQRPWGRYARHRRSNRIATPLPALLFPRGHPTNI